MTEREKIEKTYEKIRTKFPDVTNKEEIDKLAIKLDKRNLLLKAAALFGGAILCYIVNVLLSKARTDFSDTSALVFITMLSALFEMVRTLIKYSKVEKTYKPVIKMGIMQPINVSHIMKRCGSKMRNLSEFSVIKERLYDKEDELDVLLNNATKHDYYLYFKDSQTGEGYTLKVKKDAFEEAVIGSEYFVVITKDKNGEDNIAIDAYSLSKYTLSEDVLSYCNFDNVTTAIDSGDISNNIPYQPNIATEQKNDEPVKKVLPILSFVFCAIGFFIFGLPMTLAALTLSIIAVARQRSKIAITSLVVSIIMFALTVISVFYA